MLVLKIVSQCIVGIASLIAILIDYKWHDKRKKLFKRLRLFLILLAILGLGFSVTLTVIDDRDKSTEISNLNSQLAMATDKLDTIQESSKRVENKLQPFLDLAAYRFPDLDTNSALKKLRTELQLLNDRTDYLTEAEQSRQQEENNFQLLKNTPPSLDMIARIEGDFVHVGVIFKNKVPVYANYSLVHKVGNIDQSRITGGGKTEIYPPLKNSPVFFPPSMGILQESQRELKNQKVIITLNFESIYFKETLDPRLKGQMSKVFRMDQILGRLIPE